MEDSLKLEIRRALSTLTGREREVMESSFGLNDQVRMSLEEIGDSMELTRERVRQIRAKAIRRLQKGTRSEFLKNYLG